MFAAIIFFRFDRRLLGELPKLAWQTVLEIYRAVLDRRDVTPGIIAAIHTFGQVLHFRPHLHALCDRWRAFAPDRTFIPLPELHRDPFEKLWQKKVFDRLLKRDKINESGPKDGRDDMRQVQASEKRLPTPVFPRRRV